MTEDRYSLENIDKKLYINALQLEFDRQTMIRDFRQKHPNDELPKHMKDDFSIPAALGVIVREIRKLKGEVDG